MQKYKNLDRVSRLPLIISNSPLLYSGSYYLFKHDSFFETFLNTFLYHAHRNTGTQAVFARWIELICRLQLGFAQIPIIQITRLYFVFKYG